MTSQGVKFKAQNTKLRISVVIIEELGGKLCLVTFSDCAKIF